MLQNIKFKPIFQKSSSEFKANNLKLYFIFLSNASLQSEMGRIRKYNYTEKKIRLQLPESRLWQPEFFFLMVKNNIKSKK